MCIHSDTVLLISISFVNHSQSAINRVSLLRARQYTHITCKVISAEVIDSKLNDGGCLVVPFN